MRSAKMRLAVALALGLVICLPGVASAYLAPGWWIETGAASGTVPFTKIEVFVDVGTVLTDVVLTNLSDSSWTNILINSHYSVATGPSPGSIEFNFQFPDPGTTPVEVEYLVWNGDVLNSQQHLTFTATSYAWPSGTAAWGYYAGDGEHDFYGNPLPSGNAAVPLPPSVVLLGSGLAALGFKLRQQKIAA